MNYDKYPVTELRGEGRAWSGWEAILAELRAAVGACAGRFLLAVETYPGVDDAELLAALEELAPETVIDMRGALPPKDEYRRRIEPFLTDDRVFGRMCYGELRDYQDAEKLAALRARAESCRGLGLIYGLGASELCPADCVVLADMARWEIQQRFRRGAPNYYSDNGAEDNLKKFKQGYFFEWRLADKIKRRLYDRLDYYLDTNRPGDPAMMPGALFRAGLRRIVAGPFRTVPYFDPGVWGGQWMKEVCGLDRSAKNYAWSFDGVPEENSVLFRVGDVLVESPALNVVLYCPHELLGPQVFARYGAEFPIRFDFLDTMGGQNLSLQVHPLTDYIHSRFGMAYTQDESYYILDAAEDACVYLGVREETDGGEMLAALRRAQEGGELFDAEKYVNRFPAKKHDHFLIPAGTIHCSGSNCMVLEISATPYIFTFKLWDWGRLGLDGRPRPIHIDHGEQVIQWDRRTRWVRDNLVNRVTPLAETPDFSEERTGLHPLEPIETRRYTIRGVCGLDTGNTVNMLNLVEGTAALVESPTGAFEPFEVHYAETFILPAAVGAYRIRGVGGETVKVVRAAVRAPEGAQG